MERIISHALGMTPKTHMKLCATRISTEILASIWLFFSTIGHRPHVILTYPCKALLSGHKIKSWILSNISSSTRLLLAAAPPYLVRGASASAGGGVQWVLIHGQRAGESVH